LATGLATGFAALTGLLATAAAGALRVTALAADLGLEAFETVLEAANFEVVAFEPVAFAVASLNSGRVRGYQRYQFLK
jgi:hypothetical protein